VRTRQADLYLGLEESTTQSGSQNCWTCSGHLHKRRYFSSVPCP